MRHLSSFVDEASPVGELRCLVRRLGGVGMKKSQRFGQKFLPFCAGIACGIFISALLFLVFASPAIFAQLLISGSSNRRANIPSGGIVVEVVGEDLKKRYGE